MNIIKISEFDIDFLDNILLSVGYFLPNLEKKTIQIIWERTIDPKANKTSEVYLEIFNCLFKKFKELPLKKDLFSFFKVIYVENDESFNLSDTNCNNKLIELKLLPKFNNNSNANFILNMIRFKFSLAPKFMFLQGKNELGKTFETTSILDKNDNKPETHDEKNFDEISLDSDSSEITTNKMMSIDSTLDIRQSTIKRSSIGSSINFNFKKMRIYEDKIRNSVLVLARDIVKERETLNFQNIFNEIFKELSGDDFKYLHSLAGIKSSKEIIENTLKIAENDTSKQITLYLLKLIEVFYECN